MASSGRSRTGLTQPSGGVISSVHDDNYGSFHAAGYGQTFYAGVPHMGGWNRCDSSPYWRYFQVPWGA